MRQNNQLTDWPASQTTNQPTSQAAKPNYTKPNQTQPNQPINLSTNQTADISLKYS